MSNYINDYQLTATSFMTIDAKYKFCIIDELRDENRSRSAI